jgi:hypothetical protein
MATNSIWQCDCLFHGLFNLCIQVKKKSHLPFPHYNISYQRKRVRKCSTVLLWVVILFINTHYHLPSGLRALLVDTSESANLHPNMGSFEFRMTSVLNNIAWVLFCLFFPSVFQKIFEVLLNTSIHTHTHTHIYTHTNNMIS